MHPFKRRLIAGTIALLTALTGLGLAATPAQAALTYFYVVGAENHVDTQAAVLLTITQPTVTAGDFHSLGEIAMLSANGQQVVEAGVMVNPGLYGDNNPHFFSHRYTNGVAGGYSDATWVDYAPNTTVNRGTSVAGDIGTLKQLTIAYGGTPNNWWVYYNLQPVGYFPAGDWTSPTFTQSGQVKAWGEVAANVANPTTQMGNGLCSSDTSAAKFSTLSYGDGTTANLTMSATNTAKYTYTAVTTRTFRFGGDGSCP